jgi:hypothetical protein
MAWNYNYGAEDSEKVTIWDLRQIYSEIVGSLLKEIYLARRKRSYTEMFDLYDDLHTQINQKLNDKERKEYRDKLKTLHDVINKYPEAYVGRSKNPQHNYEIKLALKELEMYLYNLMEKHKMFGAKEEAELM